MEKIDLLKYLAEYRDSRSGKATRKTVKRRERPILSAAAGGRAVKAKGQADKAKVFLCLCTRSARVIRRGALEEEYGEVIPGEDVVLSRSLFVVNR